MATCPAVLHPSFSSSAPSLPPKLRSFFRGSVFISPGMALQQQVPFRSWLCDIAEGTAGSARPCRGCKLGLNPGSVTHIPPIFLSCSMQFSCRSGTATFGHLQSLASRQQHQLGQQEGLARYKPAQQLPRTQNPPGGDDSLLVGLVHGGADLGKELVAGNSSRHFVICNTAAQLRRWASVTEEAVLEQ